MPTAPTCIRAVHIHSSGRRVFFDASEWFERATDDEILVLRTMGFRAFFADPPEDSLELQIDRDDADAWLRTRRPELLK